MRRFAIVLLLLWVAAPAHAIFLFPDFPAEPALDPDFSNGPIVFDFEDGLQGWSTIGAVSRHSTGLLGGQWAIFGDGEPPEPAPLGPALGMYVRMNRVARITVEVVYTGTAPADDFVVLSDGFIVLLGTPFLVPIHLHTPDPVAQPNLREIELAGTGIVPIVFVWSSLAGAETPAGYIDNITLHERVPSPAATPLAAVVLAAFAATTRLGRRG